MFTNLDYRPSLHNVYPETCTSESGQLRRQLSDPLTSQGLGNPLGRDLAVGSHPGPPVFAELKTWRCLMTWKSNTKKTEGKITLSASVEPKGEGTQSHRILWITGSNYGIPGKLIACHSYTKRHYLGQDGQVWKDWQNGRFENLALTWLSILKKSNF